MIETKWGELLVITQKQCRSLVTDEEVINLVEQVLADYSNGLAVNPFKIHMPFFPDYYGWNNAMPSWLKRQNIHGIKWAGLGEYNPKKYGLPQCSAVIILNDMETAFPIALLDGTTVMSMRTGAAAAIMAKYCARKDSKIITLIGAGVQGTSGLEMTLITMPHLEEIRVMDIRPEATKKVVEKFKDKYPQIKFVEYTDMDNAIKGTDIILTAVHAPGNAGRAILDDVKMEKGVTLVEIAGGVSSNKIREEFDYSVVDDIEAYIHRINASRGYMKDVFGKDMPLLTRDIADAQIGDIITGKTVGRQNDEQRVHAAGIGMSIEDIVVANDIYTKAKARDIGKVISVIDDI